MFDRFRFVLRSLLENTNLDEPFSCWQPAGFSSHSETSQIQIAQALNRAFLCALSAEHQPAREQAGGYLQRMSNSPEWAGIAGFYLDGISLIEGEIEAIIRDYPDVTQRLEWLSSQLADQRAQVDRTQLVEMYWSLFHPEATGIWGHEAQRVAALRATRKVSITRPNPRPICDPARQMLFTANVLLTLPVGESFDQLPVSDSLKHKLSSISKEPQAFWYDHPIQIGVAPEHNEVLYGLRGLQAALDFEIAQGNVPPDSQITCALSISVTHEGLQNVAREYLKDALGQIEPLPGLHILVFTEAEARQLIDEILAPAAGHYLGEKKAADMLSVFGVDGEYGRHYTFLKAIAAFWQVLLDPHIQATFKIDLDQVYPQEQLLNETGLSAFEHFQTPLWGAEGVDVHGNPLELGLIAGALVNEKDIDQGLFTPDVPFPDAQRSYKPDEMVFFSRLPQALSTEAEMMARYDTADLDGRDACLQRVHVTGGTNGILVDSLRRHRPFTPSFIGRAEDQAYIFSTLSNPGRNLAYLHQAGLIMRHDKQSFAQDAIQAAQVGKLIGDYVRMLYFSAYARALEISVRQIKERVDPFTGSFISYIPTTLTLLRFGLKIEAQFQAGETRQAIEFQQLGVQRINQALEFTTGDAQNLRQQYIEERKGWELYYDTLLALERGIQNGDPFAEHLRRRARKLTSAMAIAAGVPRASAD